MMAIAQLEPVGDGQGLAASANVATPRGLRVVRTSNPFVALGLCVSHLMNKPAYGALKFASWSKILSGQINRGHYRLVLEGADRVVGMIGWAYADQDVAERWVREPNVAFSGETGDCVVFNIWSAESAEANALVLDAARRAMSGRKFFYFRRLYPDGRLRPVRIEVSRFIHNHLARQAEMAAAAADSKPEP